MVKSTGEFPSSKQTAAVAPTGEFPSSRQAPVPATQSAVAPPARTTAEQKLTEFGLLSPVAKPEPKPAVDPVARVAALPLSRFDVGPAPVPVAVPPAPAPSEIESSTPPQAEPEPIETELSGVEIDRRLAAAPIDPNDPLPPLGSPEADVFACMELLGDSRFRRASQVAANLVRYPNLLPRLVKGRDYVIDVVRTLQEYLGLESA